MEQVVDKCLSSLDWTGCIDSLSNERNVSEYKINYRFKFSTTTPIYKAPSQAIGVYKNILVTGSCYGVIFASILCSRRLERISEKIQEIM